MSEKILDPWPVPENHPPLLPHIRQGLLPRPREAPFLHHQQPCPGLLLNKGVPTSPPLPFCPLSFSFFKVLSMVVWRRLGC